MERVGGGVEAVVAGDRRLVARRARRPGVVAWRIPRHSSSSRNPASPAASRCRSSDLPVTPPGRRPSSVRPGPVDRAFIPCMVSFGLMQTSLARRQRHRRLGGQRGRRRGSGASQSSRSPFPSSCSWPSSCWARARARVGRRVHVPREGPRGSQGRRSTSWTSRPSRSCLRPDGKVQLARLGDDRRKVVTFDQIPPEILDATTAVEDKDVLGEPRLRPGRLRLRRHRHPQRQRPRRLDDHPAARARAASCPRRRSTGSVYDRKVREIIQSIRLTEAYPGTRASRRSPPTSTRTSTATRTHGVRPRPRATSARTSRT